MDRKRARCPTDLHEMVKFNCFLYLVDSYIFVPSKQNQPDANKKKFLIFSNIHIQINF